MHYTIGDLEDILHLKRHIIHYWEQEIPLIQPQKNRRGKRVYSDRDLQLLLRLKHLIYTRRFTVEGAAEELYRELSGYTGAAEGQEADSAQAGELKSRIEEIRSSLIDIFFLLRRGLR
jgi:DNA-binding transcriptional MerR regulator